MIIRFLGTSGQNIDDLGKYSEANNNIEFMERTLRWRHLAPTAPNTLGQNFLPCYTWKFLWLWFSMPKVCYSAQFILWFYKVMLLDCKLSWWHKIYDLGKGRAKKIAIFVLWRVCNSIWLHIFLAAELVYSSITFPGCYPFTDRDPFYVETCPRVYFVGNQDKYESRLIKGMFWIFELFKFPENVCDHYYYLQDQKGRW